MGPVKRRILLVEDESALRNLVRRRAEREGLEVLEAGTSAEGLAIAIAAIPDVVVVDLHLPDGSGLGLLAELQAEPRTTSIPIVAWSGDDAAEGEAAASRAGACAYFEKRDVKGLVNRVVELAQPRTGS